MSKKGRIAYTFSRNRTTGSSHAIVNIDGQSHIFDENQDGEKYLKFVELVKMDRTEMENSLYEDVINYILTKDEAAKKRLIEGIQIENLVVAEDGVYFEGEKIFNTAAERIIDLKLLGLPFENLTRFLSRLMQNPSKNSREQLYRYIDHHGVTITEDGNMLMYKAVLEDMRSWHEGEAYVDGKLVKGKIPNPVGSTISMDREKCVDDPHVACNSGLHVGAWDYVGKFGNDANVILLIEVDPRDVVSIPHHESSKKIRCCKYTVLERLGNQTIEPVTVQQAVKATHTPHQIKNVDTKKVSGWKKEIVKLIQHLKDSAAKFKNKDSYVFKSGVIEGFTIQNEDLRNIVDQILVEKMRGKLVRKESVEKLIRFLEEKKGA